MLNWTEQELKDVGASITAKEIMQQPKLWRETFEIYNNEKESLNHFLKKIVEENDKKIRVIFTGAGTSAYVGDVVRPHLIRYGNNNNYQFEAISTTDIVAAPYDYLIEDQPTLLVSFARSGNSPESVATVNLANKLVKNIKHLIISCAPEGKLAINSRKDHNSFLMLMPELSNDQGFAMTGSFSCMTLAALLTFDRKNINHESIITSMEQMGLQAIENESLISDIVKNDFERVVYLGSGSFSGLTREAQLKLLELTAGKISTAFDSSLGFRHGPKSFVNEKTLVLGFVSNDEYTSKYDVDILEEIKENDIALKTVAISQNEALFSGETILVTSKTLIPDGFLALPFVMVAQIVSLLTSVKVGNRPDTPSPSGTVNRVVKGVTIHSL